MTPMVDDCICKPKPLDEQPHSPACVWRRRRVARCWDCPDCIEGDPCSRAVLVPEDPAGIEANQGDE